MEYVSQPNMNVMLRASRKVSLALNEFLAAADKSGDLKCVMFGDVRQLNGYRCNALYLPDSVHSDIRVTLGSERITVEWQKAGPQATNVHVHVAMKAQDGLHMTEVPLFSLLRGLPSLENSPPYQVYFHKFGTDGPDGEPAKRYVGMTRQHWMDRWQQHYAAARSGSPYLWHRSLREYILNCMPSRVFFRHRVGGFGMTLEEAADSEEKMVAEHGLAPLGYNMIPGGFAGMRYLHKLGLLDKDRFRVGLEDRARFISDFIRTNPAIRALWADPMWAARVICGHSGRLTLGQVRAIRELATRGVPVEQIAEIVSARHTAQVRRLLRERTYRRVA